MKVKLETRESKTKRTKCNCCNGFIYTCEKYTQVVNADTGRAVAGEKYCKHCKEYAVANWEAELVFEDNDNDGERSLRERETFAAYQAAGVSRETYFNDKDAGYC
jgi:hypothetical protein